MLIDSYHSHEGVAMPTDYRCSACDWKASVGGYHGFDGNWFNALYCRHCGAPQVLESRFSLDPAEPTSASFDRAEILSSTGQRRSVRCGYCGATGPLGSDGPITDDEPTKCPKCKTGSVVVGDVWKT
jgi:hypothetical protein